MQEYVVVDLETTGLSKHFHQITEIAAIRIQGNKVLDEFQTLVNPRTRIPGFITRLTGIDNEMVKHSPTIKKVLPHFFNFLDDDVMVAHNAAFDYGFLHQNSIRHLKKPISNDKLCTRRLANRLLPELPSKRLSNICEFFEIKNDEAHRALSDAKVTADIFSRFLKMMKEYGLQEKEDILKFQTRPTAWLRRSTKYLQARQ